MKIAIILKILIKIKDKNISLKLVLRLLNKENKSKYNNDNLIDEIIGTNKKDEQNYPHFKEFFKAKFCNENNLIIKYKLNIENNDNNSICINCIYKHEIKIKDIPFMKTFYVDNLYLKNNLIEFFNINYEAEEFDNDQKYINILPLNLNNCFLCSYVVPTKYICIFCLVKRMNKISI